MRLRATVLAGLAVAVAACGSQAATSTVADPAQQVTQDRVLARTHEAPSLLQDQANSNTVYLADQEMLAGECRFYTSGDRGQTWVKGTAPKVAPYTSCSTGGSQPQNVRTELKQDAQGTLFYLTHAVDPSAGGARSVILGRSTDRGKTWTGVAVAPAPKPDDNGIQVNFQAHMAIDPGNQKRIYVIWRRAYQTAPGHQAFPARPWMAVSDDGGVTFGAPYMMLDKNTAFDGPRPIVVGTKLFAFYRVSAAAAGQPTTLWAASSTDAGKSWTETKVAEASDASEPIPLYDSARRLFHLVWHDNRNKDLDIFYSQSADGVKWSAPVRLNDDSQGNRAGQYYPQLALASNGRLDVAWYDFRNDPYPAPTPAGTTGFLNLGGNLGRGQDVYMTSSTDGGKSWARNLKVNDHQIDRSKGTWNAQYFWVVPLSITSDSTSAVVAWSDTRNGTAQDSAQDLYTGRVRFDVPAAAAAADPTPLLALAALGGLGAGAGIALLIATAVLRRRRASAAPA